MLDKKKVLENSFFYIFSSLLITAMGFILLPVYTFFLTPDEYGIINLVMGFVNVFTFIVAFSIYSAAIRFYPDYKDEIIKLKSFYGTIIIFIFFSGIVFLLLGYIFKNIVVKLFFKGLIFYPIVLLAFLNLIFMSLYTIHQSILQGMQQGKKLAKLNLIVFIITALFKIIFIGVFKLRAVGFLLAQLIVNIIYFIYIVIDLNRKNIVKWTIDIKILKETLKYSIPLIPHNLSTRIASLSSRIFINKTGTLIDVGIYSIAMQFGNLIDVIQVSVNKAFQPWFYELMSKKDVNSKSEVVNFSNVLLIFYSLVYMVIGLFSQEVVILMTNTDYILSWTVIPIFVIGFSIKSVYYFYVNIIMYYKKAANKLFISTIIGSSIEVILSYFLVKFYGMYGAALAFVISKIAIVTLVIYLSKKYNNIGYRVNKMLKIIVPSLLFMILGLYFSYTKYLIVFNYKNIVYKLLILLIYILFIYFSNKKNIDKYIKSRQIKKLIGIK